MICRKLIITLLAAVAVLGVRAQQLVVGGSGSDVIGIFNLSNLELEWSYTLPDGSECNSVDMTKGGNVLFSYRAGVRMVDCDGNTIWDYPVTKGTEAQTAHFIDDGSRVLVGICANPSVIVELDATSGKELRRVNFDSGIADHHAQFRQISTSIRGGYLIPLMWASKVIEIDTTGRVIAEWDVPSSPFSVKELSCNRIMVSAKDVLVELDLTTSRQDTLCYKAIGNETLHFVTEAERLDDGVTVITNWQGYAPQGQSAAQIIWIDRYGKPFKTFDAPDKIKNISCLKIIE